MSPRLAAYAAFLLVCMIGAAPRAQGETAPPYGVWLIDAEVAIQIFDCSGMLCGRIRWLQRPRDPQGQLKHDKLNPDPALRSRQLCGLTILWNLRPNGDAAWESGWLYNPDDGQTYRVVMSLQSADVIVARIYIGLQLFGKTKTLVRIPVATAEGWC